MPWRRVRSIFLTHGLRTHGYCTQRLSALAISQSVGPEIDFFKQDPKFNENRPLSPGAQLSAMVPVSDFRPFGTIFERVRPLLARCSHERLRSGEPDRIQRELPLAIGIPP